MQEIVDAFLGDLRNRFAECSWIDLRLEIGEELMELVGEFLPNRDGVLRRHAYRLAPDEHAGDKASLSRALAQFEAEIQRAWLERR